MQRSRRRREPGRAQGKLSLPQGVQHGQLFLDGPRREPLPERALALQNFGRVEAHGVSPGNCFSKRFHASLKP